MILYLVLYMPVIITFLTYLIGKDSGPWQRNKRISLNLSTLPKVGNLARAKYKYGYEVPRDFRHAVEIDERNGNTKWQDATKLELASMEAYQVFKDQGFKAEPPPGYKVIRVHLIYDVKHDGRHKARLVADGHFTDIPMDSVYSGVVSLRGLRMFLFISELNGLIVWATDVGSAYLEAFTNEMVCIIAGPEFENLQGH